MKYKDESNKVKIAKNYFETSCGDALILCPRRLG